MAGNLAPIIIVGIAVALGMFMADWVAQHTRHSPAASELPMEPQNVDEYVKRHYPGTY